jgi:hypothetical protein
LDNVKAISKRIAFTLVLGAALGVVIAFLIAPSAIEWYANPAVPTVCSCAEQIQWALGKMRSSLETAAVVSAVITVAAVEIFRRIRGPKTSTDKPAPSAPA